MQQQRVQRVRALLAQAGSAHHDYEQNELAGALDEDWPGWYARYLLSHGLGELVNRRVSEVELSRLLRTCDDEFRREQPREEWPDYYAQRIVASAQEDEDNPASQYR